MSRVTIIRTADVWPGEGILSSVRNFLFGLFKGWSQTDERGWRKIWKRLSALEPGEFAEIEFVIPRSLPFHRRHMAIEGAVFDAQERFDDFEQFRIWLKVGAGWVDQYRKVFGDEVKVVYACEGGVTVGQPSPVGIAYVSNAYVPHAKGRT